MRKTVCGHKTGYETDCVKKKNDKMRMVMRHTFCGNEKVNRTGFLWTQEKTRGRLSFDMRDDRHCLRKK